MRESEKTASLAMTAKEQASVSEAAAVISAVHQKITEFGHPGSVTITDIGDEGMLDLVAHTVLDGKEYMIAILHAGV